MAVARKNDTTRRQSTFRLALVLSVIVVALVTGPAVDPAAAQEEPELIPECENAPFASRSEARRVERDNPDCYELRDNYETGIIPDALPLQDISAPTTVAELQQTIAALQQIVALLQEVQQLVQTQNQLFGQ